MIMCRIIGPLGVAMIKAEATPANRRVLLFFKRWMVPAFDETSVILVCCFPFQRGHGNWQISFSSFIFMYDMDV